VTPADLAELLKTTAAAVLTEHDLDTSTLPATVTVERPRNPEHGDYATNLALQLGKKVEHAETFEALRARALDLAKHGMQITRFKGLGEMNVDELWQTTMDPVRRLLIRADVEDDSAADLWFSRLMGDEVEPRREFIEANALDVRFLDV